MNEVIVATSPSGGAEATDRDVNDYVYAIPAFPGERRFSLSRYQEALRRASLTDVAFERDVRRELTRARVEAAVWSGVKVSEAEVEQAFTTPTRGGASRVGVRTSPRRRRPRSATTS